MIDKFKDEDLVNQYINSVLQGNQNPINFRFLKDAKVLKISLYINKVESESEAIRISTLTNEIIDKSNKKQIRQIINELKAVPVSYDKLVFLAYNMYLSIGYARSMDLLSKNDNKNYGPVSDKDLESLFANINANNVLFEPDGKGHKPILNEKFINLAFGQNNKVKNTPIKNYLNRYNDKKEEIKRLKEQVLSDMTLSQEEKEQKLQELDNQYKKYTDDLQKFIGVFGNAFNEWDIIEEEFLKTLNKSKLKIKLNMERVTSSCKTVANKRKIPDLGLEDSLLLETDVFDYVGYDTQFTVNPEKAGQRAIDLSRRMDLIKTKKFPDITVKKGKYTMKVYNPQDRRILSAGYRSGCCFRPNGNADNGGNDNSLLTYCTTTEYGGGVEILDEEENTIMFSPILRNGNMVMIHSVETVSPSAITKEIGQLIVEFSKELIKKAEEQGDEIDFVTITDLHYTDNIDLKGSIPASYKFKIYDPENKFIDMYNNLDKNHMILSNKEGKKVEDIRFGEVDKSYEYDLPVINESISITVDELNKVNELNLLKEKITFKANKRYEALKENDEEMSYELLKEIKELKKEYLVKYKELSNLKKGQNLLEEYNKNNDYIKRINKELNIDMNVTDFTDISHGRDWYIAIDKNGKIYANALKTGRKELMKHLKQLFEVRKLNKDNIISNEEISSFGGLN